MTIRAITLGLLLALGVAALSYPNRHVLGLPGLVGTQLPLAVCLTLAVILFLVNPLLARVRVARPLSAAELAVVFALGVTSGAFPEGGFFRQASGLTSLPAWHGQTNTAWQSQHVLSYVPGSARLGAGHVHDWPAFAQRVLAQRDEPGVARALWEATPPSDRPTWARVADPQQVDSAMVRLLVQRINDAIARGNLHPTPAPAPAPGNGPGNGPSGHPAATEFERARASRAALAEAFPGLVEPAPRGNGVLLRNGMWAAETHAPLVSGGLNAERISPANVPWRDWMPVMLLWGGLAVTMSIAGLCLAVIVHPQWAYREQLTYPIARVLSLMLQRDRERPLPDIAYNGPFLATFAAVFAFHLVNGLSNWLTGEAMIPLRFDLNPLRSLFPNFSRPWQAYGVFSPSIYLAAVAFAYFLPRAISFTFGIATPFFCLVAGWLLARGISGRSGDDMEGSIFTSFTFGAFLGLAVLIFYSGRRYYPRVAGAALGLGRRSETPPGVAGACRVLVLALVAAVGLFWWGGLSVPLATLTVLLIMLLWLVVARIVCETGLYRLGVTFAPVAVLTTAFGTEALGPTTIIVVAIASVLFTTELTQTVMPYALNGLRLTDEHTPQRRGLPRLMGAGVVVGFLVAAFTILTVQYQVGLNQLDRDVFDWRSAMPFDAAQKAILNSEIYGLTAATAWPSGELGWSHVRPNSTLVMCIGLGVLAVVLTAAARWRVPGWPIHPVLFAIMDNWAMVMLGFSFLIGWAIKSGMLALGGARLYQQGQPVMVAIIAASLLAAAGWLVVGWVYYAATGYPPTPYNPF